MTDESQTHRLPKAIGKPATSALVGAGYTSVEQLVHVTERELLKLHGVGPKAIRILKEILAEKGLSFADANSAT